MHKVHDRFFKSIYTHREHAEAHLRAFLDPQTLDAVELSTLRPAPTEHVGNTLEEHIGDLRYIADGVGLRWVFRLAFESQSSNVYDMPLRMGRYCLDEIDAHLQSQGLDDRLHLPVVYPMVLYHGRARWTGPRRLSEMYGQPPEHLMTLPHVSPLEVQPHLIDVWRMSDEALRVGVLGGLPLMALKYGRAHELLDVLPEWSEAINAAWQRPDRDGIFTSLLTYWSHANPVADPRRYRDTFRRIISREAGEIVMNKYQEAYQNAWQRGLRQGHEQGLTVGRVEGRAEGRADVILNMLQLKFGDAASEAKALLQAASPELLQQVVPLILSASTLDEALAPLQKNA
ncbi:MAG: Rpn family recombination-promoting nuclease/putative transposase [Bradymonadia bacterium]